MSSFKLKKVALVVLSALGMGSCIAADVVVGASQTETVPENDSVTYNSLTISGGSYTNNGSATATSVTVESGSFTNNNNFEANDFSISGGTFQNSGTLNVQTLQSSIASLNGYISASEKVTIRTSAYTYGTDVPAELVLDTPLLSIESVDSGKDVGYVFSDDSQIKNVDEVSVTSFGSKTGFIVEAEKNLHLNRVSLIGADGKDADARVEVYALGSVHINELTVSGDKGRIQVNSGAVAEIDNIVVRENGLLNLQTCEAVKELPAEEQSAVTDHTGTFNISNVYVENGGNFRVAVYGGVPDGKVNADNLTLTLESGAIADLGGWKEDGNKDWDPDRIFLTANNITVNVLDTENLPTVYLSGASDVNGNAVTKVGALSVVASGSNNSGDAAADLQKLSGVVKTNTKTAEDGSNESVSVTAETIKDITLTQEANDIYDGATASVDETGAVTAIQSTGNVNIDGIAGIASTGFLLWRDEMTSLNRRLDDLRDSSSHDNGLWVRAYNSRSGYGARNITSKYTAIQVGYDRQISNQFWLGGAFSYTDGDHEVAQGSADNSLAAFTLYGTWMNDSGLFVDVTGKYGRIDNDFDINLGSDQGVSSGDYDTNAWGISVQAGWRWQPNMFFVEPQVELMYGRMSSVDYTTSTGLTVDHDAVDSLIGRAGFRIGVDYPDNLGRIYLRASVLHDWKGEADYTFTKGAISRYETDDLSGTWYEVGVGANFNVTDNLHIIGDLQTSHGGEVDTDYRVNLVARYSF